MSTSEIAKLESRWRENRQGLTFAPLAEAYRKMKEPQRALEILGEGLALHPEYIPASIVLGRCHLDLGDDVAAETAFLRVLTLDAENVIALKALAEITERNARFGEAENWLRQLLTIDRSNDEARGQLARVDEGRRRAEADTVAGVPDGEPPEPLHASDAEASGSTDDEVELAELPAAHPQHVQPEPVDEPVAEHEPLGSFDVAAPNLAAEQSTAHHEDPLPTGADRWTGNEAVDASLLDVATPVAPGLDVHQFEVGDISPTDDRSAIGLEIVHEDEAAAPIADAELRSAGVSEFQILSDADELGLGALEARSEASDYQSPDAAADLALQAQEGPRTSEYQGADAAADLAGGTYGFGSASDPEVTEEYPLRGEADSAGQNSEPEADAGTDEDSDITQEMATSLGAYAAWTEPVAERESIAMEQTGLDPSPASVPTTEPPAVVAGEESDADEPSAETAGTVEPHLVVTESMAELYLRQGHHSEALTIYRELYLRRPDDLRLREKVDQLETAEAAAESGEAEPAGYSAADTGGQSVTTLFQQLLAGRPAPAGGRAVPHPAGAQPSASRNTSAAPAGAGEPTRPADDRLSLSSVFGDDTSPVPPAVPGGPVGPAPTDGISFDDFFEAPATAEPTTRRPSARQDDDLDQFHAWLQNLKR